MSPGLAPNLEITRAARRILVSKWIDLGRLSIHATKNSIMVRGILQKLPGADAQITSEYIESIYQKLQAIPLVQSVTMQFDNWTRNTATGSWTCLETAQAATSVKQQDKHIQTGVYEIR